MQIQLPVPMPKSGDLKVTTRDFRVVEGNHGYAVHLGDRVLGFSGDDVAAVALKVEAGRLHISLQGEGGVALREYQVPSTDLLRQDLHNLSSAGIYFSPRESEELRNLMRLSMTGSVSRQEILLILDEISHMAPELAGTGRIDAGDLYPDLAKQVRQLMGAMPDDIQRYVLLSNRDQFSDQVWQAVCLLSKLDSERYPALTRFLAGETGFTYVTAAELREAVAYNPLNRPVPLTAVELGPFRQLVDLLGEFTVSGETRLPVFPQAVARMLFEHFPFQIPDFSAADSFEELEARLLDRLASQPAPGANSQTDNLRELLRQRLDVHRYRELADFLNGRPNALFGTEAREGLLHFLRHPPDGPAATTLGSIGEAAWQRITTFLRNQQVDLAALPSAWSTNTDTPHERLDLAKAFGSLSRERRLALFVMDHLDPVRDPELFQHFDTPRAGLTRLTPALEKALQAFLDRGFPPPVHGGLSQFQRSRFENLAEHLRARGELELPAGYLPLNGHLRRALADLDRPAPPEPAAPIDPRPRIAPERRDLHSLGQILLDQMQGYPAEVQDQRLTMLLRQHLQRFAQVAVLDRVWQGESIAREALEKPAPTPPELRAVAAELRAVADRLSGESNELSWSLWRRPRLSPDALPAGVRPSVEQRLLRDFEGPERYLQLDRALPERGREFDRQVEELSWVRRLQELAERLERHAEQGGARQHSALERSRQALVELRELLLHDGQGTWEFHGDSPLSREKFEQFRDFREALLKGRAPTPDKLFEAPFLRDNFGSAAEQRQQQEMRRLEPLFRETLQRFDREPAQVLDRLLDALTRPHEVSRGEAGQRVQQLVTNLHDFNQHQNLNQQPMYLSMPLKWGDAQSEMELAYFRLPGGSENKHRYLVVIHLDFDRWGHLRVDALREGEQLSATFFVANSRMRMHLNGELPRLQQALSRQGVGEIHLSVKQEPAKAESRVADLCLPRHDGELDFKV